MERSMQTKTITIDVDGDPYSTDQRSMTGAQIKALAHKPPANVLYKIDGHHRTEIDDDEIVELHDGEKFMTQPPVGGAS
jgi:hypothetical protein